jgi:hypothetical protein
MKYTLIKIGSDGQQLAKDAAEWDAVLMQELGLMFCAKVLPEALDHDAAKAACAAVSIAGFNDWRLPERNELESILDLSRHDPAIDPEFFPDTPYDDWYWTNTPTAWSSVRAWIVLFHGGDVYYDDRNGTAFVRPVRAVSAGQ